MTHQEIIDREIVEQYVLDKLSAEDRRVFQEHFFGCDDCFQQTQTLSETLARVRHAAAKGALDAGEKRKAAASSSWLRPMFAFSIVACILLLGLSVMLLLGYRHERATIAGYEEILRIQVREQKEIEDAKHDAEQRLQVAEAERAKLQEQLDQLNQSKASRPDENLIAQANIPSVTLESSRDSGSTAQLTIPAAARTVSLLIPVEPGGRFHTFSVEVLLSKAPVARISGARPNRSGSLAVKVSAARLESGDYRVRLYGVNNEQRELLAEYDLHVLKK
jgi:hypothetical protein